MAQNSGANQGGTNKAGDKSADSHRKHGESGTNTTEAKPLDPGTGTDGRAPGSMKGRQR